MKIKKILLLTWFVICLMALIIVLTINIDAIVNVANGTSSYFDSNGEHTITFENFSILGWALNTIIKIAFCSINAFITFRLYKQK